MAGRNRARFNSARPEEVEYFLFIDGLSPQCRWQELKDALRKIPPDGHIRQAQTGNENVAGLSQITILHKKKAFDSYDHFLKHGWRGDPIRLVLVTKDPNDPQSLRRLRGPETSFGLTNPRYNSAGPLYPTPNVAMVSSPLPTMGMYNNGAGTVYSNIMQAAIPPAYPATMPLTTPPMVTFQQTAASTCNGYEFTSSYGCQCFVQQPPSCHTAHCRQRLSAPRATNKTSSPSNARGNPPNKSMDNEGRTVYLYNLPYTVSEQAIEEYLAPAGPVDRCIVKEDRQRSSKYKVTAVATFRTCQQAQVAIERFNGVPWKGFEVRIKLDRGPSRPGNSDLRPGKSNPAALSRTNEERREVREGPLVVNGSGPSTVSRHSRIDSDDESSSDGAEG